MKKAGSSKSKSKTPRTSKNTPRIERPKAQRKAARALDEHPALALFGDDHGSGEILAVGHSPAAGLTPQDAALFRAFQSNLLSLISHELRTPLTGILNALNMLDAAGSGAKGADAPPFSSAEMITMARTNAQRLHRTLVALLDLAALESGTFHARLREVDLFKLATTRMDAHSTVMQERGLTSRLEKTGNVAILADPQKLGRALDLCLEALIPRAQKGSPIQIGVSSSKIEVCFTLAEASAGTWEAAWSEALAGYQGGVSSPSSAFAGVMQSEEAFLTRLEEGLGSEFMLIHEILRLHHGTFNESRKGRNVTLTLQLPELSSEEGLRAVLTSRAYDVSTELKSVALVLVSVPGGGDAETFAVKIRKNLFRSSDAVYSLPSRGQVALVLDDCKSEDAPRLVTRLKSSLGLGTGKTLEFGIAHCPADGLDPSKLFDLAQDRLTAN